MPCRIVVLLLLALGTGCPSFAERYAVLVGVSHYAIGKTRAHVDLDGPDNDVPALRSSLLGLGFAPTNITTLLDEEAAHDRILAALRAAVTRTRPGDFLLFYFSGHGTSSFDRVNQAYTADIGPNSGALMPYDLDASSAKAALKSIVIGRRDLRPILARLDPGARALVILDACYSQDSSKGVEPRGDPRMLDLSALVDSRQMDADPGSVAAIEQAMFGPAPSAVVEEVYPYSNVVSLAASSRDEVASDMSSRFLEASHAETVDHRPHGAFTNSLLIGLAGAADSDHDGTISADELFRFARDDMRRRSFKQTPQILEPSDTPGGPLARSISLSPGTLSPAKPADGAPRPLPAPRVPPRVLLLRMEGVPPALREGLLRLPAVVESHDAYDLLVRHTAGGFELRSASSALLADFADGETDRLTRRVAAEHDLSALVNAQPASQDFNLALDLASPRHVGSVRKGQNLKIVVDSAQPAYLLLFDIDPTGSITVLYPGTAAEAVAVPAGHQVALLSGVVRAPFGTEYLKLLAFRAKPAGYDHWRCAAAPGGRTRCLRFDPGSEEFHRLMQFVREPSPGRSEAVLRIVSTEQ